MKRKLIATLVACALFVAKSAFAHRLDEYLQAAIISLQPGAVSLTFRLVPGVAVAPAVIADIDQNTDGALSKAEQLAYAGHVISDLRLVEDGHPLELHLVTATFPAIEQLRAGTEEIEPSIAADLSQVTASICSRSKIAIRVPRPCISSMR